LSWESIDLLQRARAQLRRNTPVSIELEAWNPAAVLLLLYHLAGTEHILLTVRSNDVEHHKGQISFPGGAVHAADADLEATALRETYEEVGLDPDNIEVLGRLDDMVTNSHFRVTPVVGVLHGGPHEFIPSPAEVAEVLEVPLRHLLKPQNCAVDRQEQPGETARHPTYEFQGHRIWGATARILADFLQLLDSGPRSGTGSDAP
jgi:8-oxo-dGTP pyrophosphatase MutT (NUDIX family)